MPIPEKPENRLGQSATLSLPAADGADLADPPTCKVKPPTGKTLDLTAAVKLLEAVPDGDKGGGAPARWQIVLPAFTEPGDYTVTFGDDVHQIHVNTP